MFEFVIYARFADTLRYLGTIMANTKQEAESKAARCYSHAGYLVAL